MSVPKVSPIFQDFRVALEAHASPRVRSQKLAAFALDRIVEAKQFNARGSAGMAKHRQFVDGRADAPLASVKPDGVIVATFDLLTEVLTWIGDELVRESPVLSGRFAASHVLFADGVPHDPQTPIPEAKLYTFVNIQPYARKIENGHSRKVPAGLYEGVSVVASKRFGNVAKITMGWQALDGAAPLDAWAGKTTMKRRDRDLKGAALDEWLRKQPTIFVRPL